MDIREARETIGTQSPGDYIIDPKAHRDLYRDIAPALSEVLDRRAVQVVSEAYDRMDKDAIEAGKNYRFWMRIANLGALFTSGLSASSMAVFLIWDQTPEGTVLSVSACLSAATGAAALYFLRQGHLLETWMRRRAAAETQRIAYFNQILKEALARDAPAPLLGMEYFRRYQLDVQKSFFQTRSRQHDRSARKTVAIGAFGAFLATLASFFGVAQSASGHAWGAVTVVGAALGAYAIGREQMTQDLRNAERYERTYASLLELSKSVDRVFDAVLAGNMAAGREFAFAVDEQISNEHRQWLQETEATSASLERIEVALATGRGKDEDT